MSRLKDEIDNYKVGFRKKAPIEVQNIMLEATKKLESLKLSKNALKTNDVAKEISLPNAVGNIVSLYDTLENYDFAIVKFYRGQWCAYCNLELKAFQEINDELASLNTKLIAVSPQSPDASLSTKEKNELQFEVLSDNNNLVAKDYGLIFSLAQELRPIYKSFNIDIPSTNGEESYEIPMPATYLINKNKEIIYSFIDEDYTKRCEPQDVIEVIKNLKKK